MRGRDVIGRAATSGTPRGTTSEEELKRDDEDCTWESGWSEEEVTATMFTMMGASRVNVNGAASCNLSRKAHF